MVNTEVWLTNNNKIIIINNYNTEQNCQIC